MGWDDKPTESCEKMAMVMAMMMMMGKQEAEGWCCREVEKVDVCAPMGRGPRLWGRGNWPYVVN